MMGHITYPKGLNIGTPIGSKCRTFRVTTVRPCSSAVAAMSRSAPSFPRVADNCPHLRAVAVSTESIRSLYQASTRSSHRASSWAKDGLRCCCCATPRSISPTVTTLMYMSDDRCASTQRTAPGCRSRLRSADRTSVSRRNITNRVAEQKWTVAGIPDHPAEFPEAVHLRSERGTSPDG